MNPRGFLPVCLSLAVALPLFFVSPILAQEGNARISGIVTDPSKAVITSANIVAVNVDTNLRFPTKTNGSGIYVLPELPIGDYRIEVEHIGFKSIVEPGLVLHTQDALELNFEMALGSASESVTVNSAATNDSPAVSMTVTREFVENIPLNGRSFQDLIQLAPGTVSSAQDNGMFSVNGQRDDANNFTVDGISANLSVGGVSLDTQAQQASGSYPAYSALGTTQTLISVDAMQEFRIQTSGYAAEFGRQPGGQVEITSRSGTDQFHGTAYDYLRNTIFDANNWFANNEAEPRLPLHQNDFGGTLGGPLTIPKLYNGKGRTFFFGSYEGLRLLLPEYISGDDVPTIAFRQSAAAGVQPFLNANPLPNGPANPDGITAQYNGGVSPPSNIDATGIRVDHALSDKYRFFVRVADTPTFAVGKLARPTGTANQSSVNSLAVTAGATSIFRPDLVDEIRFNYSRLTGISQSIPYAVGGGTTFPCDLVVPAQYASLPGGFNASGDISISHTSLQQGYGCTKTPLLQHQLNLIDSLSWTRGSHSIKLGADYRRLSPTLGEGQYVTFFNLSTLSDIQNGVSDYFAVETGVAGQPIFTDLSLYAQDHWKISSRVTFDYGLRWEFDPSPGASNGLYAPALTSSNLSTATLAPSGTPVYQTTYTNFAPRAGVAWRVNHYIALRGGAGVFFDTGQSLAAQAYSSGSAPFVSYSFVNNFGPVSMPFTSADFVPPPLNSQTSPVTQPYAGVYVVAPNLKLPYTVQWNASLDGNLSPKNTVTLSYVGNAGRRLLYDQQGLPGNPAFYNYANLVVTNASLSSYNALQLQDMGYVTHHLQLIGSYTWSHSIDTASTDNIAATADSGAGVAPLRGNSDNDLRQNVNGSVNWDAPGLKSNELVRVLTEGWSIGGRVSAQSGYPLTVYQDTFISDPVLYVTSYVVPNLVPGVPLYLHNIPKAPGGWEINSAALSEVPVTTTGAPAAQNGDEPRNYFREPGFWTMNSALQKSTKLTDQVSLLFRAEAFNALNHPVFGNIQTVMQYSGFGEATATQQNGVANSLYATGTPRSLQFMLKLQF